MYINTSLPESYNNIYFQLNLIITIGYFKLFHFDKRIEIINTFGFQLKVTWDFSYRKNTYVYIKFS